MNRLSLNIARGWFLAVICFLFVPTVGAQIIEGQTPSPCKSLQSNDFVPSFYPYSGSLTPFCNEPPVARTENSIQGFGDGSVSYFFPDYTITYRGGTNTGGGYTTADLPNCEESSYTPQLVIELSAPAREVSFDLQNLAASPVTFTVTDNLGRTSQVGRDALGQAIIPRFFTVYGTGITSLVISQNGLSSDPDHGWFFSIKFVSWLPDLSVCNCDTTFARSLHTVTGHDWQMNVEVSNNDGIVLRDVMLNQRYMAKEISVPYYTLQTSALPITRAELKPDSNDAVARSRLIDYRELLDDERLVILATYAVDQIPPGSNSCLRITQRYEFYKSGIGCEPTETLPCTRFKPIMEYEFQGQNGETLTSINVVQRDHFQVDGLPGNAAGIFHDCNLGPTECPPIGIIFQDKINPVLSEMMSTVIRRGNDLEQWDNYHQTSDQEVDEPGFDLSTLSKKPGCPECVHIHWRWGDSLGSEFGDGFPLIPPHSDQDVDIAVVRYNSGEEDPLSFKDLLIPPDPIQLSNPVGPNLLEGLVFWYSATGHQTQDQFFTHGGFFNPAFRNRSATAGPVLVNYFNLFVDGALSATLIDPSTAGPIPTGYSVYNNLAYDISTEAIVSGPHTVSITLPNDTPPEVLASLRILHGEKDPVDPNRTILVDRTILSPHSAPSSFAPLSVGVPVPGKVISAKVNSFSPFVIARVSDTIPPASTFTVSPTPNTDGWNNGDVTVTINSIDDSAVRMITYTNALNGVTATVAGATATFPVTTEGSNEITYYATDQFGNAEAQKTLLVYIDHTPPTFLSIGTPTPEPNAAGWNNSDVSISYTTFDDRSGVFPSSDQFILSNEGTAVQGTITITDRAGNSTSAATPTVKIDKTSPVTTHNVNISGNQATVALSAADNLSGIAATSYSVNGGATQTYSGPFIVTGAGNYTVTYYSRDIAGNTEATKTATFTVDLQPRTVTLVAIKDSFLRDGSNDTNEGANERLRIQNAGNNRSLVTFDLSGISITNLVSATLVMNIAENSNNWGTSGRLVDVQRLLVDWAQGNGRNDVMAGGGSSFRGVGEGATWNCAKDSDIHNQRTDCATPWNGGSFAAATAAGVLHSNGLLGEVRWDVTADVRAGAGFGWVIKKRDEDKVGQVRYYSLEGAGGNMSLAPRLILVFSN